MSIGTSRMVSAIRPTISTLHQIIDSEPRVADLVEKMRDWRFQFGDYDAALEYARNKLSPLVGWYSKSRRLSTSHAWDLCVAAIIEAMGERPQ